MLKELLQYMKDHNRPEIVEAPNGKTYSTRDLTELDKEQAIRHINVRSLTGLVNYIQSNFDTERPFMVHVEGPMTVTLYDALNKDNNRRTYVEATAMLPRITYDNFMDLEKFVIQTQSNFIQNDNALNLLQFVGSISQDDSKETTDNGISQTVVAKTGVATKGEAVVPNPVFLKPFRTFAEVAQPESSFVLRIKEGPRVALFEADGGAWELNAMHNIKEYLLEELKEEIKAGKVVIIA